MSRGTRPGSGLRQVALLGLVFLLPLAIAAWLYFGDSGLAPAGRTNHGALLQPIVNIGETLPNSTVAGLSEDHWLLIYANEGPCEADCADALYTLRQARLMLGPEMARVRRVFLRGQMPPDTVLIEDEHPDLITIDDEELGDLLDEQRPRELPRGGYFLVDPLGNLVMYFPPDIVPGDMVDDLEHLLDLSRIG
jgi:hypothetical protein